jgi:hypothetical protein
VAAGLAKPRDSDSLAERVVANAFAQTIHSTNDLVSENQWQFGNGKFAIDNVKVRPANGAGLDFYPQLSRSR